MALTLNEQYAASAACFIGGLLSVVTHLWMLFDFLPLIRMQKSLRSLHIQLTLANLGVVAFFFLGAVSHFERQWIFGDLVCKFYVFWCKFTPIAAMSILAVCLYAEYQHASDPSIAKKDEHYVYLSLLAWGYGLFWGIGALTWAEYGQEPAGFTCTVIWYKVQPYVTYMSAIGFGLPSLVAAYYAYSLWSTGLLIDNPLATSAAILCCTMGLQFGAYASGYIIVCLGFKLSLYAIAFAQVWTKALGVVHPFVYSSLLAEKASPPSKDD